MQMLQNWLGVQKKAYQSKVPATFQYFRFDLCSWNLRYFPQNPKTPKPQNPVLSVVKLNL